MSVVNSTFRCPGRHPSGYKNPTHLSRTHTLQALYRSPQSLWQLPNPHKATMNIIPASLLTLLFLSFSLDSAGAGTQDAASDLVRSSCVHASYPNLCLRTLSSYAGPANTPRDLAQAAVKVSLSRARRVSRYLDNQASALKRRSKRERVALRDCIEQMSDSVDELSRTLDELKHLRTGETFRWQMSNAQTWVSAALTYEDTCLDGFEGAAGRDVKQKIRNVARVTSNALYMINRLDQTRG